MALALNGADRSTWEKLQRAPDLCQTLHRGLPWSLIQSSEHVHDVDIIHFRCEEKEAQNLPPEVTGSQLNSAAQICIQDVSLDRPSDAHVSQEKERRCEQGKNCSKTIHVFAGNRNNVFI